MDKETSEELEEIANELEENIEDINMSEIIGKEYEEGECPTCSKPGRSGVRDFKELR
jgi:hypothetical protein